MKLFEVYFITATYNWIETRFTQINLYVFLTSSKLPRKKLCNVVVHDGKLCTDECLIESALYILQLLVFNTQGSSMYFICILLAAFHLFSFLFLFFICVSFVFHLSAMKWATERGKTHNKEQTHTHTRALTCYGCDAHGQIVHLSFWNFLLPYHNKFCSWVHPEIPPSSSTHISLAFMYTWKLMLMYTKLTHTTCSHHQDYMHPSLRLGASKGRPHPPSRLHYDA